MLTYATILALLLQYRYWMLFPIMILEGPIIAVIGGFFSASGIFNVSTVYALSILGDLTGDLLYYTIGRWGRHRILHRFGRYIGVTEERLRLVESHFDQHAGKTLILAKATQVTGGPALVAAGISRMSIPLFLWYNVLGTLPKSLIFVTIGYYFGANYAQIDTYIWVISIVVAVVLVALLSWYLFRRRRRK